MLSAAVQLLAALPAGLFGGNRSPHQVDLLVVILVGIVSTLVWAAGTAVLAYRLFVVYEGRSTQKRWAAGVSVLLIWTVAVVVTADWIVD